MVLPFDHTHDLDLVISRSKFEIASFEEWGWGMGGWGVGGDGMGELIGMEHNKSDSFWSFTFLLNFTGESMLFGAQGMQFVEA